MCLTFLLSLYHFLMEKAMAPHSSTLAWKIPWMEEPGRLQSMGSWIVRYDWSTSLSLFTFMHWRRKWQPTPVFLPGESQGQGRLVGCRLWGRRVGQDWSDLAAAAAYHFLVSRDFLILIKSNLYFFLIFPLRILHRWAPMISSRIIKFPLCLSFMCHSKLNLWVVWGKSTCSSTIC